MMCDHGYERRHAILMLCDRPSAVCQLAMQLWESVIVFMNIRNPHAFWR